MINPVLVSTLSTEIDKRMPVHARIWELYARTLSTMIALGILWRALCTAEELASNTVVSRLDCSPCFVALHPRHIPATSVLGILLTCNNTQEDGYRYYGVEVR